VDAPDLVEAAEAADGAPAAEAGPSPVPGAAPPARRAWRRPFGIYVIIVLQLLHVVTVMLDVFRVQFGLPSLLLPEYGGAGATMVNYAVAALLLVTAVGLWLLKRWAWVVTMLTTGFGLALGLVRYWQGVPIYGSMAINVLIVLYLNQRAVRRAFEGPRAASEGGAAGGAGAAPR
jgi:hypothetical protein